MLRKQFRDFRGGAVGKTRGRGSIPGQGSRSRMHAATKKSACYN